MLTKITLEFEHLHGRNYGKITVGGRTFTLEFEVIDLDNLSLGKKFAAFMEGPSNPLYWYDVKLKRKGIVIDLADEEKIFFCLVIRKVEIETTVHKSSSSTILFASPTKLVIELENDLSPDVCAFLSHPKFGCTF